MELCLKQLGLTTLVKGGQVVRSLPAVSGISDWVDILMALEGTGHIDEETTYQILLKNRADFFSHQLNHSWHLESVYSLSF